MGVTYASSGLLKVRWLPKLYVVNPVSVVYDLVDQSGPKMTTFSSTAYATQKGHLLRGEERVTVALRGSRGRIRGCGAPVHVQTRLLAGGKIGLANRWADAAEFFPTANGCTRATSDQWRCGSKTITITIAMGNHHH